jgi:hypothetical protein
VLKQARGDADRAEGTPWFPVSCDHEACLLTPIAVAHNSGFILMGQLEGTFRVLRSG